MTTDSNELVDMDDLDTFENAFFERTEPDKEVEEVKETVEETEEVDETEEDDSLATEDEENEDADEEAEDEEEEPKPEPKPKRNRAQERIEKLLERERLATERANVLEARLAALEAQKEVKKEETPALREQLPPEAPNPDAKDKDGNPIYDLGEFDPKFIRDLTKFTIEQETKAAREKATQEARQAQVEAAQKEIQTKWAENLDKAETELPEIRENIQDLVEVFQDIDPNYGEYLAATIMASDHGPQMMNYLSQNIGEAQRIVASGPAAATLALGRLEGMFVKSSTQQEEKRNTKLVSKAAEPPVNRARGSHGQFTIAPDTDDLDAFERVFFKKR